MANPYLGRMVPEFQQATLRERIVAPYRVIYHVDADLITVLTVLHSRQDLRHLGNG